MTNSTPGMTLNQLANLPVAATMTIALPARSIVTDNHTDRVIKTYDVHGNQ